MEILGGWRTGHLKVFVVVLLGGETRGDKGNWKGWKAGKGQTGVFRVLVPNPPKKREQGRTREEERGTGNKGVKRRVTKKKERFITHCTILIPPRLLSLILDSFEGRGEKRARKKDGGREVGVVQT